MECAFVPGAYKRTRGERIRWGLPTPKCMNLVGTGLSCRVDTSRDATQFSWNECKGIPRPIGSGRKLMGL
jgi:hypothetical protein